jgi:ribosomal protein S18 acetylase RimI-like enzyme
MSDPTASLTPDAWLSEQLDRPCFIAPPAWSAAVEAGLAALPAGSFAYAKIPSCHVADVHNFEAAGFRLVDTNVTFERLGSVSPPTRAVRLATPDDAAAVARVARESYRFSRFHLDARIDPERAAAIKAAWTANFFAGRRGSRLFVADSHGQVAGFLLAIDRDDRAVIDLIAVSPNHQRQGIAAALIEALAAASPAATTLVAGTQIANTPSVRMYETLGFRLAASACVLHYHA